MRLFEESDDCGVAMIELALVLTFLAVLVFGIIDFGYTLSDYQNLRQGVREAAREAANNPAQFNDVNSPTCAPFTPPSTAACFYDFIVARTGLSASQLTISWSPSGTALSPIPGGKDFEVCVNYTTTSITGFAAPYLPKTLHSDVLMRMEPPSSTFPAPTSPAVSPLAPCP